jgi:hypothetical protein
MELPITEDTLISFSQHALDTRRQSLSEFVLTGIRDPMDIVQCLSSEINDSIHKKNGRMYFNYTLKTLPQIYTIFGDVDNEVLGLMYDYMKNFPGASVSIDVTQRGSHNECISCKIVIRFALPWLSAQTNTHPR